MIHVQPIVFTVRFYEEGKIYPDPFIAVATVQLMGAYTIYVGAMNGKINRQNLRDMAKYFKDFGIKYVLAQRKGVVKQFPIEDYL